MDGLEHKQTKLHVSDERGDGDENRRRRYVGCCQKVI